MPDPNIPQRFGDVIFDDMVDRVEESFAPLRERLDSITMRIEQIESELTYMKKRLGL